MTMLSTNLGLVPLLGIDHRLDDPAVVISLGLGKLQLHLLLQHGVQHGL